MGWVLGYKRSYSELHLGKNKFYYIRTSFIRTMLGAALVATSFCTGKSTDQLYRFLKDDYEAYLKEWKEFRKEESRQSKAFNWNFFKQKEVDREVDGENEDW